MTDYSVGDTFDIKFTTRAFATGIPTTAASLTIAAYPDNSTTELTAGITVTYTSGFDSRAGLVNVRVVATTGNGYAAGSTYYLVVTAGTVDSVSIVGEVVGEFTLGRSSSSTRLGTLAVTAATGDPGTTVGVLAYLKQLVNVLIGSAGVTTFPAEAAPANAVSLAEVIRAIHADVTGLNGSAMRGTDSALLSASYTAPDNTGIAAIQAKTDNLPNDPADESLIIAATDALVTLINGLIGTPSADLAADIAALTSLSAAEVNAEVVDALTVDTQTQPGQVTPAAAASIAYMVAYLYKLAVNKKTQSATTFNLYNSDDATVDQKASVDETAGVVTVNKHTTGP